MTIFPDARLKHRVLGEELLRSIVRECVARQLDARNLRIGTKKTGSPTDLPVEWINGFQALVGAVKESAAIVSSDSLPGHLAEYFGRPVFIFTPRRKDYWMPGSAFEARAFAMFDDAAAVRPWLDRTFCG